MPIDIQSLDSKGIMNLPHNLTIYGHQYQLAGSTLCSDSHFTAICFWYGQRLYYDGVQTKRIIPFSPHHLTNKTGSYAYYFKMVNC